MPNQITDAAIAGEDAPSHAPMAASRSFRRDVNRYCGKTRRQAAATRALKKAAHRKLRRKTHQDLDHAAGRGVTGRDAI